MKNIKLLKHPILQHKLSLLRAESTNPVQFRQIVEDLTVHLAYEASTDLTLEEGQIKTPIGEARASHLQSWPIIIAVMRAGMAMVRPVQKFLPLAKVGHIGVYRDSRIDSTVEYFFKMPSELESGPVFILDTLIATGDTADSVISRLKELGAKDIRLLCLLASKEGLEKIAQAHSDIPIYLIGANDSLTEEGFLTPGIGDAGQRYFNCR